MEQMHQVCVEYHLKLCLGVMFDCNDGQLSFCFLLLPLQSVFEDAVIKICCVAYVSKLSVVYQLL